MQKSKIHADSSDDDNVIKVENTMGSEPLFYAKLVNKYKLLILGLGILSLGTIIPGFTALTGLEDGGAAVPGSGSLMAEIHIDEYLRYPEYPVIVMLSGSRDLMVDSPQFVLAAEAVVDKLTYQNVQGIISYTDYPEQTILLSNNRQRMIIVGSISPNDIVSNKKFRDSIVKAVTMTGGEIEVMVSGQSLVNNDIMYLLLEGLKIAEISTLPFVVVLLFMATGGVVSGLVPWSVCITTISWSLAIVVGFSKSFRMGSASATVVTMFGVGLGIDYSLFIMTRYQQERAADSIAEVERILDRVLRTSSRTVTFSAITVFLSLLGCFVFHQFFLVSMCKAVMIVSVCTCISANTILLALLATLDTKIFACPVPAITPIISRILSKWTTRLPPSESNLNLQMKAQSSSLDDTGDMSQKQTAVPTTHISEDDTKGMWYDIGKVVTRNAWPSFLLSSGFLLALCVICLMRMKFGSIGPEDLPSTLQGRRVYDVLKSDFSEYGRSRLYVFLKTVEGEVSSPEFLNALLNFTANIKNINGVNHVRSPLNPGNYGFTPSQFINLYTNITYDASFEKKKSDLVYPLGLTNFNNAVLVHISLGSYEFSASAKSSLRQVKELLRESFKGSEGESLLLSSGVTGVPAAVVDLYNDLDNTLPTWIAVMIITIFLLLLIMTGSLTIPLKACVFGVLGLGANLGLLTLIFAKDGPYEEIGANGYFDGPNIVFVCALTFSLSVDYEIFLISQIQEIYYELGDTREAICRALQRSGRLITAAAFMLALVTGAFLVSELIFIKYIGLGVAMAVLLDATIVRSVLVPATLSIMNDWCWYCPEPIKRVVDFLGLQEAKRNVHIETDGKTHL